MIKLSPSIISADFAHMGDDITKLEIWGASYIHCDVMDGVFVPNISFGPQMIKAIKGHTSLPIDVHLMIDNPERYIEMFAESGADIITVHQEATMHLHKVLELIKSYGIKAGVALNPATTTTTLKNILDLIDQILIMTVNPGFGGQKLIPSMIDKVRAVKQIIQDSGKAIEIEVDGGINIENISSLEDAGANIIVAGSAIFNSKNPQKIMKALINPIVI